MNDESPGTKPKAKLSVLSLCISGVTSIYGASVLIGGRGGGMEALSSLLTLTIFGGGGLLIAFFLGLAALFNGEQPTALSVVATSFPIVACLLVPVLGG